VIEAPYVLRKSLTITGKIKVHALLTPDNYADVVLDLLDRAKRRPIFRSSSQRSRRSIPWWNVT
jgi:hypothetical protein